MIVRICGLVSAYAGRETGQALETHGVIRTANITAKLVERCE